MYQSISLIGSGGTGDFLLGIHLKYLLNQLYPKTYSTINYLCARDETFEMIKTLYPDEVKNRSIQQLPENFLEKIKTQEDLDNFCPGSRTFLVWPDKLFRGFGAFPLKEFNITNFLVKQTRTLLGKWKPENYISLALNSITNNYTYHSIPELSYKLAHQFPDKKVYIPLLTNWNNKELQRFNFPNPPDNLEIDINPEFSKVFDILCKSEYCVCTDNAIMHICHDLGMPFLTLDPQFSNLPFEARWRPFSYYNSIPISSLVDDVIDIVKTQIEIPETQMISMSQLHIFSKVFYVRQNMDWSKSLIFKG